MVQNKVHSCFAPLQDKPQAEEHHYVPIEKNDIVDIVIDDVVVKTGDGDRDFVIQKEAREVSRINRRDFLNSQSNDLGILNIIKKVQLSGDVTLLNQRHRPSVNTTVAPDGSILEDVQDYTNVQKPIEEIQQDIVKGRMAYDSLPEAFKAGTSFESFAEMSVDDLNKVMATLTEAITKKTAEKGKEGE